MFAQSNVVPLIKPDASRDAAPPAKTTKTAYEMAESKRASSVPFGIELAGSFKSPEMFAPACSPVTKSVTNENIIKNVLCEKYCKKRN